MPRRARMAVPGIPWRIIQRENNPSACFYAEEDYRRYLDTLQEQAERHACAIHAYVLMTNHVHLWLTLTRQDSVGLLMKHLGQWYVQYINLTYRRSGTLWEGCYRSCLARDPEYVLGCYRYIEMNPMLADMVGHPREYRWSSYRANAEGEWNRVITPHQDYLGLGASDQDCRESYRSLFSSHLWRGIRVRAIFSAQVR